MINKELSKYFSEMAKRTHAKKTPEERSALASKAGKTRWKKFYANKKKV